MTLAYWFCFKTEVKVVCHNMGDGTITIAVHISSFGSCVERFCTLNLISYKGRSTLIYFT
jgi:hypothetical protein